MGLLEDAIREHLELKRLRGADPGEVAREQREALEPPANGESAARTEEPGATEDQAERAPAEEPSSGEPAEIGEQQGAPQIREAGADLSHIRQETAEFDMGTVLHEGGSPASGEAAAPSHGAAPSAAATLGDSLEWDVPRTKREAPNAPNASEVERSGENLEGGPKEGARRPATETRSDLPESHPEQGRLSFE